jgi:uncharacterized protein
MISAHGPWSLRSTVDMTRVMPLLKPALVVLLVVVLLVTLVWLAQRRLIYLPDRGDVPPAATISAGASDVTLQTADGLALNAYWVPARTTPRKLAVLVAPGNAGNRVGRVPLAEALSGAGFDVLLLDYRGYGGNPGRPTEEGLAHDARAAYRWLTDTQQIPPERLIYFGESLGTGVVTELATSHPPGGLLLRSPFVDLAAVGSTHYPFLPVRAMLWDRYEVAEHVTRVAVPTVVVYGSEDSIIPPEQSRQVAERAAGPVRVIEVAGADHNDAALFTGTDLLAALDELAREIG